MTGYQKDVIRSNAGALLYVLDHEILERLDNISGGNGVKLKHVLIELKEEFSQTKKDTQAAHNEALTQDAHKKGKLVKSTDPRKAKIVAHLKELTTAPKITNVKETEFCFKGTPHYHIKGSKTYSKGSEVVVPKTHISL